MFLHRFQEGRLRLGRRAVDFVRENDVRENRPALKLKTLLPVFAFDENIRAGYIGGHEVGRELNARKDAAKRLR